MKNLLKVTLQLALLAAAAWANPIQCQTSTLLDNNTMAVDVVNQLGATGCSFDGYTFNNFNVYTGTGSGVELTGLTVVGNEIVASFNPNEGVGTSDVHLQFEVSGGPILGGDLALGAGDTLASISEANCSNNPSNDPALSGTNCATNYLSPNLAVSTPDLNNGNPISATQIYAGGAVSQVWVWKDILIATPGGDDSAFTESFLLPLSVPEPMPLWLTGLGLLALAAIGPHRRKRRD
jgi:MYXO-CTERM domain-containing protein